ncbi:hypothetical protein LB507_002480 [Fusarium sp. FIESC RH6]|nr:hypothetical protein LB507_002480 [Fusarium sp. FIESC RH6]
MAISTRFGIDLQQAWLCPESWLYQAKNNDKSAKEKEKRKMTTQELLEKRLGMYLSMIRRSAMPGLVDWLYMHYTCSIPWRGDV